MRYGAKYGIGFKVHSLWPSKNVRFCVNKKPQSFSDWDFLNDYGQSNIKYIQCYQRHIFSLAKPSQTEATKIYR